MQSNKAEKFNDITYFQQVANTPILVPPGKTPQCVFLQEIHPKHKSGLKPYKNIDYWWEKNYTYSVKSPLSNGTKFK